MEKLLETMLNLNEEVGGTIEETLFKPASGDEWGKRVGDAFPKLRDIPKFTPNSRTPVAVAWQNDDVSVYSALSLSGIAKLGVNTNWFEEFFDKNDFRFRKTTNTFYVVVPKNDLASKDKLLVVVDSHGDLIAYDVNGQKLSDDATQELDQKMRKMFLDK